MLTKSMIQNLLEAANRYPPDVREYRKMANSHIEALMHIDNMAKMESRLKGRVEELEDALRRTIAVPEVRDALSS